MGPKRDALKKENSIKVPSIEDAINSDTWKCAVVMVFERTSTDSYVLKCFTEEAANGRRPSVKLINFDTFVMKILNDFAIGEVPFKYSYLLHFSSVFQEAAEYVSNKSDIPVQLLVKVVKALLLFLKEENQIKNEKKAEPDDPIKAMAERPKNAGGVSDTKLKNAQKKVQMASKKGKKSEAGGLKVKPPSATKQETKLLKRGEGAKEDQCIDDAPLNGYFNLYVILTGFYYPDFPLELLKADVPLYGILCIDTSLSGMKRVSSSSTINKQKRTSQEIQNFWDGFLKLLWDPKESVYFKDTILQVYVPQRLQCEREKLKEFIYKEISYLAYDLSDLKKQLDNYLKHLKLWDVEEVRNYESSIWGLDDVRSECVTSSLVLRCIIDAVCGEDSKMRENSTSSESISSGVIKPESSISQSLLGKFGSSVLVPAWSRVIDETGDHNTSIVYSKTKQLDIKYNLDDSFYLSMHSDRYDYQTESNGTSCHMPNHEEAPGAFTSYWRKFKKGLEPVCIGLDYCLYSLLLTKVLCPYSLLKLSDKQLPKNRNSNFELIDNIEVELRKPHFTVTESSRKVLQSTPYNIKETEKDFFSPQQFKIVTPEKLKASSAPEFHNISKLIPDVSFISEPNYPSEVFHKFEIDVFENVRGFLEESMFENVKGFDFVEELSKPKLTSKERQLWGNYNCVDYNYSILTDSLFVVLHNRTGDDGTYHETFSEAIRTGIGLRDFYEYVLGDEAEWLQTQQESVKNKSSFSEKSLDDSQFADFNDSFFWMEESIKYQEKSLKLLSVSKKSLKLQSKTDYKKPPKVVDKPLRRDSLQEASFSDTRSDLPNPQDDFRFEGYNISNMTVQFSGLKTQYHAGDCSISVQLIERLYGDQHVGVHISQGGHTLYLYSYACPEPHLLHPHVFHITLENGTIIAFGRRFIETFTEVEELESRLTLSKDKKSSSLLTPTPRIRKKLVSEWVEDDEFFHDMKLSLPNSLKVSAVRRSAQPCYIKQQFLIKSDASVKNEEYRLFLPNGNTVRMLTDGTVHILKLDTSILTTSLVEVTEATKGDDYTSTTLANYHMITPAGYSCDIEQGRVTSSRKLHIFQNTDVESQTVFFRRRDETNYMLLSDGTLCMQFEDGTKISSSPFVVEESDLIGIEEETDFVLVHLEVVVEHPDYATVMYNTHSQKWKIKLPFESEVTVDSAGAYFVKLDKRTELTVGRDHIQMNRFGQCRKLLCSMIADLTVFENLEEKPYCRMEDSNGRIFIVEPNSNCYVLHKEQTAQEEQEGSSETFEASEGCKSADTLASEDLGKKLSRKNKYFVVKRDLTGFQILHNDEVKRTLTEVEKGSVVFTQEIPGGNQLRYFVLISPAPDTQKRGKWEVESVIPNPKFIPHNTRAVTSSTYGDPPSWMHPFPKKKRKFQLPEALTCRVFVETRKTDISPTLGCIECRNCKVDDVEVKHSKLQPSARNLQEHMRRLANDDQDILKEMYALVVKDMIEEKVKSRPVNSEKLQRYLAMSKYYVDLQEYHKKAIRYHIVPNYFHHPAGISWLLINDILPGSPHQQVRHQLRRKAHSSSVSSESSVFSNEEIEYNLTGGSRQSYSDLSCRTDISMTTAPAVLKGAICRCKVPDTRVIKSSPDVKLIDDEPSEVSEEYPQEGICSFRQEDFNIMDKARSEGSSPSLSLHDLMLLGLI